MANRFDNLINNSKNNTIKSRFNSDTGSSRFNSNTGSSRFNSNTGSSRFNSDTGSSRFNSDTGSSRFNSDTGSSRFNSDKRFGSDTIPRNNFLNKKSENKITNEGKRREEQNSLFSLINEKIKIQGKKYIPTNKEYTQSNKYTPSKKHNSFKADIKPVKEKKVEMNFNDLDFPPL
jgi:hypothetical protein